MSCNPSFPDSYRSFPGDPSLSGESEPNCLADLLHLHGGDADFSATVCSTQQAIVMDTLARGIDRTKVPCVEYGGFSHAVLPVVFDRLLFGSN